ncbi:hypothetical protein, partial [Megamonas hypermegale]|uniref:hypothetical protein n=1 Tax=Megamonas hypermegale TaxID=158847 RepID=UPI0026F2D40F
SIEPVTSSIIVYIRSMLSLNLTKYKLLYCFGKSTSTVGISSMLLFTLIKYKLGKSTGTIDRCLQFAS